jgi:Fe-S cluster assembly protein SufD
MAGVNTEAADAYRALHASVADGLPAASRGLRNALTRVEFPVRRNEAWRFTSARTLLKGTHEPRYGAFGEGADVTSWSESAIVRAHLGTVASNDGFNALNAAFFREVAVVHAEAGASEARTLTLTHEALSVPRILVVAEEGATIDLSVHHTVRNGLAVPIVEIVAQADATVRLTHVVEGTADPGHFAGTLATAMGERSHVAVGSFLTGVDIARLDVITSLGPSSTFDSAGLVLGAGSEHADHHLTLHHEGANATSTQLFRNILDDKARAVFTGEVHVKRDVPGSDATQTANTLLLSEDASAVARPWLVIDNDDVVASHGATVGRLDDEALFYLRSRGIGVLQARRLLMRAFAQEVVHTVPEAHREPIEALVERFLHASRERRSS